MLTQTVQKLIPPPLRLPARSLYYGVRSHWEFLSQDIKDKASGTARLHAPFLLPPARFRFQVHVDVDPDTFVRTAKLDAELIVNTLARHGRRLENCARILDWGCGPGKVLQAIYLEHVQKIDAPRRPQLHGSDISAGAIAWASRHLPFANFEVNKPSPPLNFPAAFFDVIYGISVFSHLDRELEAAWLRELSRLVKPDGLVIVSVRGAHASSLGVKPGSEEEHQLKAEGILFRPPPLGYRKEGLPDCYGNTYHTREYIRHRYSQEFVLLEYVERGLLGGQDLLILQGKVSENISTHSPVSL